MSSGDSSLGAGCVLPFCGVSRPSSASCCSLGEGAGGSSKRRKSIASLSERVVRNCHATYSQAYPRASLTPGSSLASSNREKCDLRALCLVSLNFPRCALNCNRSIPSNSKTQGLDVQQSRHKSWMMNTVRNVYDEGGQDTLGAEFVECMWKRNGIGEVARRRSVQVVFWDRHASHELQDGKMFSRSTAGSYNGAL